jgi:hypothetical protein
MIVVRTTSRGKKEGNYRLTLMGLVTENEATTDPTQTSALLLLVFIKN